MMVCFHIHRCELTFPPCLIMHILYTVINGMCMKIQQTWFLFAKTGQANFHLRHCLSACQLFVASRGIPGFSGRHSLSPACFMGTGGRACQMVFLRNYYVLIHCEGVWCSLPLLPAYWEVTVRLTVQRECIKSRGGRFI